MPIIYLDMNSEIEIDVKCNVCNSILPCDFEGEKKDIMVIIEPCEKCFKDKDDETKGLLDQIDELKRNSK